MILIEPKGSFVKTSDTQAIVSDIMSVQMLTSLGTKMVDEKPTPQGYMTILCLNETGNGYFSKTIEDAGDITMMQAHELMQAEIKALNPSLTVKIDYK